MYIIILLPYIYICLLPRTVRVTHVYIYIYIYNGKLQLNTPVWGSLTLALINAILDRFTKFLNHETLQLYGIIGIIGDRVIAKIMHATVL